MSTIGMSMCRLLTQPDLRRIGSCRDLSASSRMRSLAIFISPEPTA